MREVLRSPVIHVSPTDLLMHPAQHKIPRSDCAIASHLQEAAEANSFWNGGSPGALCLVEDGRTV
jgi:hypothetical protein